MFTAALNGFLIGLSLIVAIGAQNAFVLKQGLKGEFVLWVCLICALSDAILIVAGVAGFHVLVDRWPVVTDVAKWGGAAFLVAYGFRSFKSAWVGGHVMGDSEVAAPSLVKALLTCLALTWLNPHVYLDTLVFMGSISAQYPGRTAGFAGGAVTASFVWFFALGHGARLLRPLFAKPIAWRVLDAVIGCIMWAIAVALLRG